VVVEPLAGGDPGQIAAYRVQARLGASAAGLVYLAAAPDGRPVAVTLIRPEFAQDPAFRERLAEQLAAVRALQSPHLAPLLDADPVGPQPWLATGYVPGPSLQQAIAQYGPMPTGTALLLASSVAQALATAHAAGLVHGGLRPSAVLLAQSGPQVIGMGVTRALHDAVLGPEALRAGSLRYQAPEQIAAPADVAADTSAADVFALGHLAAFALLGRSPFGAGDQVAVSHRILRGEPDLAGCPEALADLIERALAKDPAARPTAAEVAAFCAGQIPPQAPLPLWPAPIPMAVTAPPRRRGGARRWPFSRPVTYGAAGGLAVAAAIVATVVLLNGSGTAAAAPKPSTSAVALVTHTPSPSPSASPSPTATPALDPCLVGSWKGSTSSVGLTMDGTLYHLSGTGPSVVWKADGSASVDWNNTTFSGTIDGDKWVEHFKGTSTEHDETRGGQLLASDVTQNGSWTLLKNGSTNNTGSLSIDPSPEQYTCNETTVREYDSNGNSQVLTRVSH
jgi:serine/threonine protein kinase